MPIESNLVIKTTVRKQSKTGFETLLTDLQHVEDRLNGLSRERFTIRLDLDFDPTKLNNLILNSLNSQSASAQQTAAGKQAGQTAGAAFNQAFQQATGGGRGGTRPTTGTTGGAAGGNETIRRTFTPEAETGIFQLSKIEEINRQILGVEERRVTTVSTLVEGELAVTKEIREQTNLLTRATNEEQKRLRILRARQPIKEADIESNRQFAQSRNTQLLATGFTEDTSKQVQQTKVLLTGLGQEQQRVTGITRTYTKELGNGEVLLVKINELTGQETQRIVKNTTELRKQLEIEKQLNAEKQFNQNFRTLNKEGFQFNRELGKSLEFIKLATDGSVEATAKLNTETGKLAVTTASQVVVNKKHDEQLKKVKSDTELLDEANRLLAAGFKELPKTSTFNVLTGQQEEIRKFFQVTSRSITGLAGDLVTLNTRTGEVTKQMLNHAQVIRLMGDTWASAAAKVTLWLGATSLVFGTIRTFRALISTVKELGQNTVFLARVGRELGDSFADRIVAAKELTDQIVELAQATGGSAIEAQKAASVFLRAGQTQSEALESVRASLIASRIAEIDVADAAVLLSSALQQFELSGNDLLPILDSLNSLSNNYRVTTDDLLKSISRAGSVFSTHGGRLEELAAITTVVAQRTSRTGTEIGNAIKTIQSNLDRLDVREEIFSKLGVTLTGVNGEALTLSDIFLELNTRLNSLSEAEQKELTLLIGGVRQRNILIAAIEESEKALIAENKSLLESGSAIGESVENSKTLEAAVSRLAATFIGFANAASGPVAEVLSGFVNLLTIVLQFLNSFGGGLLPKLTIGTLAFLAMNRALVFLAEKVSKLGFSFTAMGTAAAGATTRIGGLTAALGAFRTQAATAGTAAVGFAGGISKLSLASGVATAALLGIGLVMSANAEAALTNQQLVDQRTRSLDLELAAEQKKARAIDNTTDAIARQIVALIDLKRQGTSQQRLNEIEAGIKQQGQSVGLDLSAVNLQDAQGLRTAVARANAIRQDQTQKSLAATIKISKAQKEQFLEVANERRRIEKRLRAEKAALGKAGRPGDETEFDEAIANLPRADRARFLAAGILRETGTIATLGFGPDLVAQQVKETTLEVEKLKEKEQELTDAIAKSDALFAKYSSTVDISAVELLKFNDAIVALISTTDQANKLIQDQGKLQKSLSDAFKVADNKATTDFLHDVNTSISDIDKALRELDKLSLTDPTIDKYRDQLQQLSEIARTEFQKIEEAAAATRIEFHVAAFQRDADFAQSVAAIKQEVDRAFSDASPLSSGVASTSLEESIIKDRVKQLQQLQGDLLQNPGLAGGGELASAANIQLQKDLDRLAELQLEKALSLLDAEKNIAIERKRSADEAARALGSLSEEDKLRVRAQAAFFAANPNQKISIEQQFGASAEANRIAAQFFSGRLERFDANVQDQSLEGLLNRGGFAVTPEIIEAEQETAAARAGRTDKQILDEALNAANQFAELSSVLGDALDAARGLAAIQNNPRTPRSTNDLVDQQGNVRNLNVNVQNNLNVEPLVKAFEHATGVIMDVQIQALAKRIENYVNTRSRPRRPSIAPTPDVSE